MDYPLIAYSCYEGVCVLYPILLDGKNVGTAKIEKEGMYFKIFYQCRLQNDRTYRIILTEGMRTTDLGVCIPSKDSYHLAGRLPIKSIQTDHLLFHLLDGNNKTKGIPVETGKPFPHIDKLEYAHLHTEDGISRIVIDQFPDR